MKALISVCTGGEGIMPDVVAALFRISQGYESHLILPVDRPYESALNRAAKAFRESDCTHWLNIDSDNPPTCNPLDYMKDDFDVLAFPTPISYRLPDGRVGLRWNFQADKDGTIIVVGTGCILIAKRVLEVINPPFFRTYTDDGIVRKGPDVVFSELARSAGFALSIAPEACDHYSKVNLREWITNQSLSAVRGVAGPAQ